jgi:hypothetical protein
VKADSNGKPDIVGVMGGRFALPDFTRAQR